MNKDLEIIKHNEPKQIWNQEDGDFYLLFVPEMWDIVIQAAERMAREIEQQKECKENNYDRIIEAKDEIARLKAELEKRRKVVFCKECTRAFCTRITFALKCRIWNVQVSPNAFCSRGHRRESEEGK